MADFDDIRRGLAANLATLKPGYQASPYLLANPTPPMVQVAGIRTIEYDIAFQNSSGYDLTGDRIIVVLEACLRTSIDIAGQQELDRLHGPSSLKAAVESDDKLTSRMLDNGSVEPGHAPACDALRVTDYTGQAQFTLENGTKVILATWEVEVIT